MAQEKIQCVNCERPVEQVPLIAVLTSEGQAYICPQCLPVLIHKPQQLADKLRGAETLTPHEQ